MYNNVVPRSTPDSRVASLDLDNFQVQKPSHWSVSVYLVSERHTMVCNRGRSYLQESSGLNRFWFLMCYPLVYVAMWTIPSIKESDPTVNLMWNFET
jgi:hypothetical protein